MVGDDIVVSPQITELLGQISSEPFLVNLIPHLVKFVESKCQQIIGQNVIGEFAILNLLLKVLDSIVKNKFYDFDKSLKTVIPILMSLTLTY
jgi:hypothetical protein